MSLVIRLMRTGKKGESKYRLVVKEKRDKRDGIAVELLGWCEKQIGGILKKSFNMERVKYWMSVGAKPTPTARKMLEL